MKLRKSPFKGIPSFLFYDLFSLSVCIKTAAVVLCQTGRTSLTSYTSARRVLLTHVNPASVDGVLDISLAILCVILLMLSNFSLKQLFSYLLFT